jgi:two-component system sensor histidine kinase BaeS
MPLTLTHKLFALLAATALLAIGGTTSVFVLQLERGFVVYLDEIDRDYVARLVDVAAQHFDAHGHFDRLQKGGWKSAHTEAFGELPANDGRALYIPPAPLTSGVRAAPVPPQESQRDSRTAASGPSRADNLAPALRAGPPPGYSAANPGKAPDVKGGSRPNDPFNIAPRTQLLSADGKLVGGRPPAANSQLRKFPVVTKGQTVGFVQLAGRPNTLSGRETEHLRAIATRLFWMAGGIMLFAMALAYWVASRWANRLQRVIDVTGKVAKGQFAARTATQGADEIGRLAGHVDEMAQSLETLERSRRKWLADVAHELRTPLATLQGEIEGLMDGIFALDETALKSLHEEVRHLTRLTGDLHQLALSDLGALPIHREMTDVSDIVIRAVQRWQVAAQRNNLVLTCSPTQATMALVDETRITQVVDNLLQNSMRYTDGGGTVALAVEPQPNAVLITVDDTPPGVNTADLERMFDPLFRGDEARSRERGGSGLGLALARAIVDAHKGSIIAQASRLGGIRVEVLLPTAALA